MSEILYASALTETHHSDGSGRRRHTIPVGCRLIVEPAHNQPEGEDETAFWTMAILSPILDRDEAMRTAIHGIGIGFRASELLLDFTS